MSSHERLEQLQGLLASRGLAAFLVPKADEFQFEYVHPAGDRLAWLTGFTGSSGMAIVGPTRAGVFSDGRYTEQLRQQTSDPPWTRGDAHDDAPRRWLEPWITAGDRIGYDPRLHSAASLRPFRALADRTRAELVSLETNPIDALWLGRPAYPSSPIELYPEHLAGASRSSKRLSMAEALVREGVDALVLTDPTHLAWLLNVRSGDLEHTPLALGFAILEADGSMHVFMDPSKWTDAQRDEIAAQGPGTTSFGSREHFASALTQYPGRKVRVDRLTATVWVTGQLQAHGATVDIGDDPCALAQALKTPQELAGLRAAHRRDGTAMVRFLHWLDVHAPGNETEWTLVERLAAFRAESELYRSPSFRTISAFGPSGASPHYTVDPATARPLQEGSLYLVDSGGQYLDGTTDITRVTCMGEPSAEMRRRYTLVLRGHIALARARFPEGVTGTQLDPLARQFLWADGLDYGHGTGHGVGCYLGVHEGPQRISPRASDVALRPGMVVSNEPGFYKPGDYGIRIENLITVVEVAPSPGSGCPAVLGFENLTLCPYERRLIDVDLLTLDERCWVDDYHRWVREELEPHLPAAVVAWLREATRPLA